MEAIITPIVSEISKYHLKYLCIALQIFFCSHLGFNKTRQHKPLNKPRNLTMLKIVKTSIAIAAASFV
ncbi:hypothetical protein, partial [Alteromonas oceanisediminis]|uniref:hypothetical protein n=1 Tax=Alteromonas oceanisediminis TaxID=2836180 RepID=UPI001BD93B5A